MINEIEGFAVIQKTGIHGRTSFLKRVHKFNHCPRAHGGRGIFFIAELVLVVDKFIFIQNQNDPVQDFQEERSNPDTSVIVAAVEFPVLVFY